MSTLAVFDFDGTLFRSPEPPFWHTGKGWWADPVSLDPPCVPRKPGPEWWISKTVSEARKAIADPDTWTLFMTGRVDRFFRWRVPELLKSKGLDFDEVFLSPGGSTKQFKRGRIQKTLRRFPFIDTVRIWEDKPSLLSSYVKMLSGAGYQVYPTLVRERHMDVSCPVSELDPLPQGKNPLYVGVVLEDSRSLLRWWKQNVGPLYEDIHANHMTLEFKPSPQDILAYPLGERVSLKVKGWAQNGKVQTVAVDTSLEVDSSRIPHVTIATTPKGSAKDSNKLLSEGFIKPINGPSLTGLVTVSDSRRFYFDVEVSGGAKKVAARFVEAKIHLARELSNPKYKGILLQLLDYGFPVHTPLAKLPRPLLKEVEELASSMGSEDASKFLSRLSKPPVDNRKVIQTLQLEPRERGKIKPLAQRLLIENPFLSPDRLTKQIIALWE